MQGLLQHTSAQCRHHPTRSQRHSLAFLPPSAPTNRRSSSKRSSNRHRTVLVLASQQQEQEQGSSSTDTKHHHQPQPQQRQQKSKQPQPQPQQQQQPQQPPNQQRLDVDKRRVMEDELRDPSNFVGYMAPRPLRLVFFGFSAVSCLVASLISAARLLAQDTAPSLLLQDVATSGNPSPLQNLAINLAGVVLFGGLFVADSRGAQQRVQQRKAVREAQVRAGDREVFVNEAGQTMSRLKEVNDDWILRRLEKWGRRENMPFLGPQKGAILQELVQQQQPRLAVEVGTMAGYSAITIAQVLPRGSQLVSIEKDLSWWLVAKRFLWQASQGQKNTVEREVPLGQQVDTWLGDASTKLQQVSAAKGGASIDLLLLDGLPKETLDYLKAAEPYLSPGAMVIADNAGVFAEGGLRDYLAYVRSSSSYSSRFVEASFEWREDVPDGMEVSIYNGNGSSNKQPAAQ